MPSLRANAIAGIVRVLRLSRRLDGEEAIDRTVAADRRRGPAKPSRALRRANRVSETVVGGRRVFHIAPPAGNDTGRHVLYLHGGAWCLSISPLHWQLISTLTKRLGAGATVPLYPLAPEHTAEDVFAMLLPLYRELVEKVGAENLTVMGDSAGGNIVLSLVMQARDQGLPLPSRVVLIAPCVDLTLTNPQLPAVDRLDPILSLRGGPTLCARYAGTRDLADPLLSAVYGDLRGLPPIAVFTGTRDLTNPDTRVLRDRAAEQGADLAWYEYPGMLHVWVLAPIPEARRTVGEIVAFITDHAAAAVAP